MAAKKYPSDKLDQFIVRLPEGLRDLIRKAAEANNRSMNAEIVAALEEKYRSAASLAEIEAATDPSDFAQKFHDWLEVAQKAREAQKRSEDDLKKAVSRISFFMVPHHGASAHPSDPADREAGTTDRLSEGETSMGEPKQE